MDIAQISKLFKQELENVTNQGTMVWSVMCEFPVKQVLDDKHLIIKRIGIFDRFPKDINKLQNAAQTFSLSYNIVGEDFQFLNHNESETEGIISRIQLVGDNGFNLTSKWNMCEKSSTSTYLFGVIQRDDLVPGLQAIPVPELRLMMNENDERNPKSAIVVFCEIADPLKLVLKLQQELQRVRLTTKSVETNYEIKIETLGNDGEVTKCESEKVNKGVLAERCSAFHQALNALAADLSPYPWEEIQKSIWTINDFQPVVVKEFIKYLTSGEADFKNYAVDLFRFADKYYIKELMTSSENYIAENILHFGWSNVFALFYTYANRLDILKTAVQKYFDENRTDLKTFDATVVDKFINYLSGEEPNLEEDAVKFFPLAHKYGVQEMMTLLEKCIAENIESFGWSEVFGLLETYTNRLDILKAAVKDYIEANKTRLSGNEDFQSAARAYSTLLAEQGIYIP